MPQRPTEHPTAKNVGAQETDAEDGARAGNAVRSGGEGSGGRVNSEGGTNVENGVNTRDDGRAGRPADLDEGDDRDGLDAEEDLDDDLEEDDDFADVTSPRGFPGAQGPYPRLLPWLYLIGGGLGLLAAFVLTVEKFELLIDPSYVPSCNLNPIISCGSVMNTDQAAAFGFPNPLLGIAGFGIVISLGAGLLAGATYKRWFWLGLQVGALFGVGFVHWLIFSSLYRIGALCPYCMVVWCVTIPIFLYTTLHNLERGIIPLPAAGRRVVAVLSRYSATILTAWLMLILVLILDRFWSYWSTLL
jgi:uncharacterized membrane protein